MHLTLQKETPSLPHDQDILQSQFLTASITFLFNKARIIEWLNCNRIQAAKADVREIY